LDTKISVIFIFKKTFKKHLKIFSLKAIKKKAIKESFGGFIEDIKTINK